MKRPFAIGVDNYKKMIDQNYFYIDKTLLIKELLDKQGEVSLFTRPRRFGKTLAQSMLKTYFEQEKTELGEEIDNSHYFEGKKILKVEEKYKKHMGKYPVISISLKAAKQPDYEMAYTCILEVIASEYKRHRYVLKEDHMLEEEKEKYRAIMGQRSEEHTS